MRSWGRAAGAATTVPLSVPRLGQPTDSASLPVSAPPTPARQALKLHWPGETGPPCAQRPHGPAPFGPHIPHRKHVGSRSPPTPGAGLPGRAASTSGRTCGRRRRQLGPAATCDPCGSPHSQLATLRALCWPDGAGSLPETRPCRFPADQARGGRQEAAACQAQVRRAPAGRLANMGSFDLHLRGSVSLVTAQGHLVRNGQRLSLCGYCTVPPGLGVQDCDNIPIPGSPALTKDALASELGRQKDANPNRSAFLKAPELRPGAGNTWARLSTLPALASGLGDIPPFSPHSGLRGGEPQPGLLNDRMAPQPTPA